jgi:hypothetical protein
MTRKRVAGPRAAAAPSGPGCHACVTCPPGAPHGPAQGSALCGGTSRRDGAPPPAPPRFRSPRAVVRLKAPPLRSLVKSCPSHPVVSPPLVVREMASHHSLETQPQPSRPLPARPIAPRPVAHREYGYNRSWLARGAGPLRPATTDPVSRNTPAGLPPVVTPLSLLVGGCRQQPQGVPRGAPPCPEGRVVPCSFCPVRATPPFPYRYLCLCL